MKASYTEGDHAESTVADANMHAVDCCRCTIVGHESQNVSAIGCCGFPRTCPLCAEDRARNQAREDLAVGLALEDRRENREDRREDRRRQHVREDRAEARAEAREADLCYICCVS